MTIPSAVLLTIILIVSIICATVVHVNKPPVAPPHVHKWWSRDCPKVINYLKSLPYKTTRYWL